MQRFRRRGGAAVAQRGGAARADVRRAQEEEPEEVERKDVPVVNITQEITRIRGIDLNAGLLAMGESVHAITRQQWANYKDEVSFNAFDRDFVSRLALDKLQPNQIAQTVTTIALRGPKIAQAMRLSFLGNRSLSSFGIRQKTRPKTLELTPSRLLNCFPDYAAHGLLKINAAKRIANHRCPAHLQFPAAAGLVMPDDVRREHKSFCIAFSALLIGPDGEQGGFNEEIYNLQSNNPVADRLEREVTLILIARRVNVYGDAYDWADEAGRQTKERLRIANDDIEQERKADAE